MEGHERCWKASIPTHRENAELLGASFRTAVGKEAHPCTCKRLRMERFHSMRKQTMPRS